MKTQPTLDFYKKYRVYIFPIGVFLSCLILIVFVIIPQFTKLLSNQKVESELVNKYKILEVKASTLETYNDEDLKRKVGFVLSAYPAEKDFGNILSFLQDISTRSGFIITSFSVSNGGGTESVQSYGTKINVTGPKSMLSELLDNIETTNRIMRVESMDVSFGKDAETVEVSLSIQVFFAPIPTSFGSVESEIPVLSEKDEEVIAKLSQQSVGVPSAIGSGGSEDQSFTAVPLGKPNPFE